MQATQDINSGVFYHFGGKQIQLSLIPVRLL